MDLADDRKMYDSAQAILDSGVRFIASTSTMRGFASNPFFSELKQARMQFVLQPGDSREVMEYTGVSGQLRPGLSLPVGRGVFVSDRVPVVVQASTDEVSTFATPCQPAAELLTPMPERQPRPEPVVAAEPMPVEPTTSEPTTSEPTTSEPLPVPVAADPLQSRPTMIHPPVVAEPRLSPFEIVLETGHRVPLLGPVVVGRRPGDCGAARALTLPDPCMSARHLLIDIVDGTPIVVDQQSRNGTVIRNASGARRLQPGVGASVQIGDEICAGDMVLKVDQAYVPGRS